MNSVVEKAVVLTSFVTEKTETNVCGEDPRKHRIKG